MYFKRFIILLPGIALNLAAANVSANSQDDALFVDEENEATYMLSQGEAAPPSMQSDRFAEANLFIDEANEATYLLSEHEAGSVTRRSNMSAEASLFVDERNEAAYL